MTKVYQTIFNNKTGNCLAAVWASLLDLKLEDVPNFVEAEDDHEAVCQFVKEFGYKYEGYIINENRFDLEPELKSQHSFFNEFKNGLPERTGVNGYYDAIILSSYCDLNQNYDASFKRVCHAVVVDRFLNIVHDPFPYYTTKPSYPLAEKLGYNGLIGVCLFSKT